MSAQPAVDSARDHAAPAEPAADHADLAIIGAGAAGLFAAIWAARTLRAGGSSARVIALDGARTLGAKILVAGGGRCNVTHHAVDDSAYAGSSRNAIRNVLRAFDVPRTVAFFRDLGVELKREDTGKLFPTTDDAHTVLNALLRAAADAHAELRHPWRVAAIARDAPSATFRITRADAPGSLSAHRVILATGGMALPRSGSDGQGYTLARHLGHTVTPAFPALVPLKLAEGHFIRDLSGLTVWTTIELRSSTGKRLAAFTNSTLCTHFGLSGPGVLDISRHFTAARQADPAAHLMLHWLPGATPEQIDAVLLAGRQRSPARVLAEHPWPPPSAPAAPRQPAGLPDRLARALCAAASVDPSQSMDRLTRDQRRSLLTTLTAMTLPVTGDRGFTFAETTAGGVPLSELHLSTMESRVCPGLHLAGELLDVDGRIGGFNFQWAWASGYAAGVAAAKSLLSTIAP